MLSRSAFMLVGLALAAFGSPAVGAPASVDKAITHRVPTLQRTMRKQSRGGFGGRSSGRRAAYGWTNRHAQRVAAKKRNVARHRARAKGRA